MRHIAQVTITWKFLIQHHKSRLLCVFIGATVCFPHAGINTFLFQSSASGTMGSVICVWNSNFSRLIISPFRLDVM